MIHSFRTNLSWSHYFTYAQPCSRDKDCDGYCVNKPSGQGFCFDDIGACYVAGFP